MRILYVTSGLPYPLTSGRLRHYFFIRGLAERHEVTLIVMDAQAVEPEHVREMERFATVRLEPEEGAAGGARMALGIAEDATRRVAAYAQGQFAANAADALVLSGRNPYPLFRTLRGTLPILYDLCDARSLHMARKFTFAPTPEKPAIALRYLVSRRRERAIVKGAGAVMFGSPRDRRAVMGRMATRDGRAAVVPNGVDVDYWHRSSRRLGREIVFTGAMDYGPNTDAAIHLVDVILPLVQRELPDVRLRIVGRDPTDSLRERGSRTGVTVTGFVDDVRPHLEAAAVFAAPLRYGAGIQNKLLEAMAMEVPCVVSPLAAAGLEVESGALPPLEVAEQAEQFAASVIKALRAADEDPVPQQTVREYVERHFSWPAAVSKMESILSGLVPAQNEERSPS